MVLTRKDVQDVLRCKLGHTNFNVEGFTIEDIKAMHNHHSNNHLLLVTAQVRGELVKFSFFIKSVDAYSEVFNRFLGPSRMFEKEHGAICDIIPHIQVLAPRKITSECYLSKPSEVIVLENLTLLGFEPLGKFVDVDHARVAVEALANLHAASLITEESEEIDLAVKFKDHVYESLIVVKNPSEESLLRSIDKRVRDVGQQGLTYLSDNVKTKLFDRFKNAIVELSKPSKRFRNVITQGDPWGGNLMFKRDDNGKPIEALLVDFQASRFTPPAQELVSFLHVATPDSQFIANYSKELIELYYKCLGRCLAERGLDVATILPVSEFQDSCEVYREFGVAARVYYASNTRLPEKYFKMMLESPKTYCDFMVGGCSDIAVEAYNNDAQFKHDFDESINAAVQFYAERALQ